MSRIMISVDDYSEEKICEYKGEIYSARDNGAIMRHSREGKRKRQKDDVWTFGDTPHNGYIYYCGIPVHRVIATAFLGEAPGEYYVVDHQDCNRQNNRPENLRWCTRLENALNNEYTRKKIILICGSVEAFLENPELIRGHEMEDINFSWMRAVTKEEAENSRINMDRWLHDTPRPNKNKGKGFNESIFRRPRFFTNKIQKKYYEKPELEVTPLYKPSLTEGAMQGTDWITPTEFPLCNGCKTIEEYFEKLKPGEIICHNKYGKSEIREVALNDKGVIAVKCYMPDNEIKDWSVLRIEYKYGNFIHDTTGTYFEEISADKYFTLVQGKKWTGGEVPDDYC